MKTTEK